MSNYRNIHEKITDPIIIAKIAISTAALCFFAYYAKIFFDWLDIYHPDAGDILFLHQLLFQYFSRLYYRSSKKCLRLGFGLV